MVCRRLISMDEYLASSYEPDVEFVDGVLEEKYTGERNHSLSQIATGAWFIRSLGPVIE